MILECQSMFLYDINSYCKASANEDCLSTRKFLVALHLEFTVVPVSGHFPNGFAKSWCTLVPTLVQKCD